MKETFEPGDTLIVTRCLLHDLPEIHARVCDDDYADCRYSCCDCCLRGMVVTVKTVDNSRTARRTTFNVLTTDGVYNERQLTPVKKK